MSQINCDVIKDLLPSYVDEICSKTSKNLVNEHLKTCADCNQYKTLLEAKDTPIKVALPNELDYMKKIRRNISLKMGFFFLIIIVISISFILYLKTGYRPTPFLLLLPTLMTCNYLMYTGASTPVFIGSSKKLALTCTANLLLIFYTSFLLLFLSNYWITSGKYPFGIELIELGPFVYRQLFFISLVEIGIWLFTLGIYFKTSRFYSCLSQQSILGFCLSLYYMQMLREISDISQFLQVSRISLALLIEGLLLLGLFCGIDYFRKKRNTP